MLLYLAWRIHTTGVSITEIMVGQLQPGNTLLVRQGCIKTINFSYYRQIRDCTPQKENHTISYRHPVPLEGDKLSWHFVLESYVYHWSRLGDVERYERRVILYSFTVVSWVFLIHTDKQTWDPILLFFYSLPLIPVYAWLKNWVVYRHQSHSMNISGMTMKRKTLLQQVKKSPLLSTHGTQVLRWLRQMWWCDLWSEHGNKSVLASCRGLGSPEQAIVTVVLTSPLAALVTVTVSSLLLDLLLWLDCVWT